MSESSAWTHPACGERRQASRRLFRIERRWLAVLVVVLTFAWPAPVRAAIIWMGNWNVNLIDVTGGPGTAANPTFGDRTADLANAGGTLAASSDPLTPNSGGFVLVTFVRQFALVNHAHDSLVTLFGTLSGTLNATSAAPGIAARGSGSGSAAILDDQGLMLASISGVDTVIAINDTDVAFVLMPLDDSAILSDGIYTVSGELELEVRVNAGPVGIADANVNMNLIVGVSARSVPEPPALLLLGTGVLVLLVRVGRQRARRSRREQSHHRLQGSQTYIGRLSRSRSQPRAMR